ncbi:DctP family TRAP transporter solute-binding subunit [Acidovorax lacteus]|uniref:C4-dicarboxylate ABC transporter n=1 Tax=Acidovorax lacteus TaxID=1924988 RepID=A0ABP8L2E5_9BURK
MQKVQTSTPAIRRRRWLTAAATGLAGWAVAGPVASGAVRRLRLSHVVTEDTPKGTMARALQRHLQAQSGGRMALEVYPDSQLYGDEDELEALRLGAVDLLAPSLSKFAAGGFPAFELFDLPLLFDNLPQVRRITQGPIGARLLGALAQRDMVGLGYLDNGFKHLSGPRVLRQPADLAGLRLRIQPSAVLSAQMRAWGAEPVALPFAETRRALERAVVDGAENTLSNFDTQGLAAVQGHLTQTSHGYLGYALVAGQRMWARLAPHEQTWLREAAAAALAEGNARAAALEQVALAHLRQVPGLHIHNATATDRAALRAAAEPAYAAFGRRAGGAALAEVQRTLRG